MYNPPVVTTFPSVSLLCCGAVLPHLSCSTVLLHFSGSYRVLRTHTTTWTKSKEILTPEMETVCGNGRTPWMPSVLITYSIAIMTASSLAPLCCFLESAFASSQEPRGIDHSWRHPINALNRNTNGFCSLYAYISCRQGKVWAECFLDDLVSPSLHWKSCLATGSGLFRFHIQNAVSHI